MPLETATFVSDLIPANPAHSDGLNQADAHMRLIKAALKASFPHTGTITNSDSQIVLLDGTSTKPSYSFASEPTLGFYRLSSGLIVIGGGRLIGNGAVPVGSLHEFLFEPEGFKNDGSAGGQYLELNGVTYNTADYPRLATHLGVTASTFALLNVTDTGRFARSRRTGVTAGTKEANLVGAHGHTATADAAGSHAHNVSGSTGSMDRANPHSHSTDAQQNNPNFGAGTQTPRAPQTGQATINATDINHLHSVSGATDAQGNHTHVITVAANVGAETRPEAYSVIKCIKT